MANLYELMGDYDTLQHAMDNEELTNDELEQLLDELDETKGTLKEKVNNIVRLLASLDGDIDRFKHEEQRLSKRRKTIENKKDRLRNWIRTSMDVLDVSSVKTDVHSVAITPGKDKVIVVNESLVPDEHMRIKRDVDKVSVLKAYKDDGEIVKGCDIIKGEPRLTIR